MKPRRAFYSHLLFWLLFLAVLLLYRTSNRNHGVVTPALYLAELEHVALYVLLARVLVTFYVSLWVFTRFFTPQRIGLLFGQIVLLGLFDATLSYVLEQRLIGPLTGWWFTDSRTPALVFITDALLASWVFVMMAFIYKHVRDQRAAQALRHEKTALELAYLKSQLNPHFLFNNINSLYGLALTEPERTPDAILRLADLLRYMLYESNEAYVALSQEIDYLTSYIALEKLRHDGDVYVDFTVDGTISTQRIAPLLLICFVENAFKHGSVNDPLCPIALALTVHGPALTFTVGNPIAAQHKDQVGGVGLASVRRRLALLYPGRHRLAVADNGAYFQCTLSLDTDAPPVLTAARP
ncbi:histidine kinase [Hymenobacter sp. BT175]|uniref:sensor histidine kinase n=1 Tax=Hymenobacter translucens TaxID=2886507 RepID=UPI001D0F3515|nr:sensor histidine kinase [Hymenobacter translucens]MCC2545494.1 histidine kinase [Hymenobacter translucens]